MGRGRARHEVKKQLDARVDSQGRPDNGYSSSEKTSLRDWLAKETASKWLKEHFAGELAATVKAAETRIAAEVAATALAAVQKAAGR